MPIEIKELHIRVSVNASPGAPAAKSDGVAGSDETKEAIVADCVEQVLQILQNKMER
jgi:hypothetical protein